MNRLHARIHVYLFIFGKRHIQRVEGRCIIAINSQKTNYVILYKNLTFRYNTIFTSIVTAVGHSMSLYVHLLYRTSFAQYIFKVYS